MNVLLIMEIVSTIVLTLLVLITADAILVIDYTMIIIDAQVRNYICTYLLYCLYILYILIIKPVCTWFLEISLVQMSVCVFVCVSGLCVHLSVCMSAQNEV